MAEQKNKKNWKNMPTAARIAILAAGATQLALTGVAHADISHRPAEQIRGSKLAWRLISLISFVGPVLYFRRGRVSPES